MTEMLREGLLQTKSKRHGHFFFFVCVFNAPEKRKGRKLLCDAIAHALGARVSYLNVLKHVGVVANLPQLHDGVHQGLRATFTLNI